MALLAAYLGALLGLISLDGVWLSLTFKSVYEPVLGPIRAPHANYVAAAIFYLIYPVGIVYFVTSPAIRTEDISTTIVNGALFGLFAYSTYDLVNYALLRGWTLKVTLADIAWGSFATAVSAAASFYAASWMMSRTIN